MTAAPSREMIDIPRNEPSVETGAGIDTSVKGGDKVEPTPAMIDAGVAFALCVSLGGDYQWSEYVRDLFKNMAAAGGR